jgi:phosphoribosyl 1,2-cyclic phosphodiesterase
MDVWSIASGSSGNAYLIRGEGATVLVECGISLGRVTGFLRRLGISPFDLTGVLLTHDHTDHTRSARQLSDTYRVPIFATRGTLGCGTLREAALARPVESDRPFRVGDLEVVAFQVPHDAHEPVGFRITGQAATVTVTTDLGHVPGEVQRHLRDNDLLIVEANHDVEMLQNGPYPTFLKRRVLGRHGHLSNAATADALAACRDQVPAEVWLAHLSPTNNRPPVALAAITDRLQKVGLGHVTVRVAERYRPSLHWTAGPRSRQLALL